MIIVTTVLACVLLINKSLVKKFELQQSLLWHEYFNWILL